MSLLYLAATALRDHYVGFPDSEIVAESGMGMRTLLRDIVQYLRESGVDDDGGWACDATKDINVRFPVQFEPFTMIVEAYAVDESGEGPAWAEVTVDPVFVERLSRLNRICEENSLESVTVSACPDKWDQDDELAIRGDSLRVWGNAFWFEAHPKHADYRVETRGISICDLLQVVEKLRANDFASELPDGFLIREGIVFYDGVQAADFANAYLDTEGAQDKPPAVELDEGTTCTDCGAATSLVIGCPDGAEVCPRCFDAGRH